MIVSQRLLVWSWMCILTMLSACNEKGNTRELLMHTAEPIHEPDTIPPESQVAGYVRNIIQDKNGDMWFGTNGYGVAHYDGKQVSYYSLKHGFDGYQVNGMTQDKDQNIWFATDQGVIKYDFSDNQEGKKHFTNVSDIELFDSQRFWSIYTDQIGHIWAGSVADLYRYDGASWSKFKLPYPDSVSGDFITERTTRSVTQDRKGNYWFSTYGYGVYKYDGISFTQFSVSDGLADNGVDKILEDSKGDIWFGTRNGGLSKYNGESFVTFSQKNDKIGSDEVCAVFEDTEGNIWFSSEGYGVYRYDGDALTNFSFDQGLGVRAVQTIFQDKDDQLWVGGGGGLYRLNGDTFINIKREGPWNHK